METQQETIKKEGFFKRWKKGIDRIPPQDLLKSEIIGYWGTIFGTLGATIYLAFSSIFWVIAVIVGLSLIITISQMLQKYQQLNAFEKMKSQMVDLNEILGGNNGS